MLRTILALCAVITVASCSKIEQRTSAQSAPATFSSFDTTASDEPPIAVHSISFTNAPLDQLLDLYAKTSRRSVVRGGNLPDVTFTFSNELPMTRVKVLQALDTVLAARGIVTVPQGADYLKVVNAAEASQESPPIFTGSPDQLPDSSSYVIYAMELRGPSSATIPQVISPFCKMPNSIIYMSGDPGVMPRKKQPSALDDVAKALGPKARNVLILRDYSSNVRKMLQVIAKVQGDNR